MKVHGVHGPVYEMSTAEGMYAFQMPIRQRSRRFNLGGGMDRVALRERFEIQKELPFVFRWTALPRDHMVLGVVRVLDARGGMIEECDVALAATRWGRETPSLWHVVKPMEDAAIEGTNAGELVVEVAHGEWVR